MPEEPRTDPATGHEVDPGSGYLIQPSTGWLIEPGTGNLINPATWYYTGYRWDPETGLVSELGEAESEEPTPSASPSATSAPTAAPDQPGAMGEPVPTPEPTQTVAVAAAADTDGGESAGTSWWLRGSVAALLIAGALAYYARFRAPNPARAG